MIKGLDFILRWSFIEVFNEKLQEQSFVVALTSLKRHLFRDHRDYFCMKGEQVY